MEGGNEVVGGFDQMLFSSVCLFYSEYLLIRRGKGIVKLPFGSCRGDLFSLLKTDMAKEKGQLPAGWSWIRKSQVAFVSLYPLPLLFSR